MTSENDSDSDSDAGISIDCKVAIDCKVDIDCKVAIDWEVARSLTEGDEALLDELLELFPVESAKHLEAIQIALELDDGPSLARAAHTLKSSARLFGASALAVRAQEMETLGESSNIAEAEARLSDLQTETHQVIAALKRGPR